MLPGQKTKNFQTHALKVLILKTSPNFKLFANLQTTHIIKLKLNIMLWNIFYCKQQTETEPSILKIIKL